MDRLAATAVEKILAGERLSPLEALALWDLDLLLLGSLAGRVRRRLNPEPVVTFVCDRNINYTNLCLSGCRFCAFFRPPGHPEGYVLSRAELLRKLEETRALGGTGILLQGGLNPELPFSYYEELVATIRDAGLQVHGFSPPEIVFFARHFGLSLEGVLRRLMAAGLSSLPGGGAEILTEGVRRLLSPGKATAAQWLQVMETAHRLGLRTSATMMFGHLETRAERTEHLLRLRELQDRTGGFTAFIPWTFQPGGTALGGEAVGAHEYLRTLAVSRLVLDNIPHLQVSWVTQGDKVAQVALEFGADDFGSTMIEENVVAATGVTFRLSREDIVHLISTAGYTPRQRDHLYRPVAGDVREACPAQAPAGAFSPETPPEGAAAPPPPAGGERGNSACPSGAPAPWPPPDAIPVALIARVGAHRDFLARGVEYEGARLLETPFGKANPVHVFRQGGLRFAVLSRHGEAGYEVSAPFVNDRANLYALKTLGVRRILAWCAPGAINPAMAPGHLVVPHDILDETTHGPYTFFPGRGPGFIRHQPVFCPTLRPVLLSALTGSSFPVHDGGVYAATTGPRLETGAEVRKLRLLGGDLVGQTLVPEVFLARELELCYVALCYVVNFAEGVAPRPYQPGVLFEGLATPEETARVQAVEAAFGELALQLLPAVAAAPETCFCSRLMERYRRRGDLGEDWRTWFP
jgi:cyclic dehypoxanthinyl futalosine synthase